MNSTQPIYWFDRWAEYLTVTVAENIARCTLASGPIQKVRIYLTPSLFRPAGFKVFTANGLIIGSTRHASMSGAADSSTLELSYYYKSPCSIPAVPDVEDITAQSFITQAKEYDEHFYSDAWSLSHSEGIPALLRKLAFRSVSKLLPQQLHHQGIDLADELEVQFHDGENYRSFAYDAISAQLSRQIGFYLGDDRVFRMATETCLMRSENRHWFKTLRQ